MFLTLLKVYNEAMLNYSSSSSGSLSSLNNCGGLLIRSAVYSYRRLIVQQRLYPSLSYQSPLHINNVIMAPYPSSSHRSNPTFSFSLLLFDFVSLSSPFLGCPQPLHPLLFRAHHIFLLSHLFLSLMLILSAAPPLIQNCAGD